jgi:hypothetical protein
MPSRCQNKTAFRPGALPPLVPVDISVHQTAVALLCWTCLATCVLFTRGTRRQGWCRHKFCCKVLYACRAARLRVAHVTRVALRESATLANSMLGHAFRLLSHNETHSHYERDIATCGNEYVRMIVYQPSACSQSYFGVWPLVVGYLETLLCSCMPQDAAGTHESYNPGRTDAHGHYSDRG